LRYKKGHWGRGVLFDFKTAILAAMFFSFDGIDGVGKSTQMQLFCEWLAAGGHEVATCRDPGSTPLGERVREIVLHSDEKTPIGPRTEMLLYMAARAQLVDEKIRPALASEKVVVSDRFLLANVVYQGYAGGLEVAEVREVGRVATQGLSPDCTFLLDMDPAAARTRMGDELDRMESRGEAYRETLREGFLAEAAQMGSSVHIIDANRSIEAIQEELRRIAQALL
jgi:dTMP kinase